MKTEKKTKQRDDTSARVGRTERHELENNATLTFPQFVMRMRDACPTCLVAACNSCEKLDSQLNID